MRPFRAAPCFALLLFLVGCTPEENYTTPLVARVPTVSGYQCLPESAGYTVFVLDLFRYEGPTDDAAPASGTRCGLCASGDETCTPLARTCRCSGPRSGADDIQAAIRGARFEDVPPDDPLCVRLVAIEDGRSGPTTGPGEACECPADVPSSTLGICALSAVGSVNEGGAPLQLSQFICKSGRVGDGGTIDCDSLDVCDRPSAPDWCASALALCEGFVGPTIAECASFGTPRSP